MRKIERNMIAAIRDSRNWREANTAVTLTNERTAVVWLHGSVIAKIPDGGVPEWTLAGWNTPTTRSRINALARELNWTGVHQRRGVPFAGKREISSTEWVPAF